MKKKIIYAMYKGDTFITTGTLAEIAAFCGISFATVRVYTSPTHRKRMKNRENCVEVFRLEDDEQEDFGPNSPSYV